MQSLQDAYEKLSKKDQHILLGVATLLLKESKVEDPEWIPIREAAELLGISGATLRKKIEEGVVRSRNVGERKTTVLRSDILSLIKEV